MGTGIGKDCERCAEQLNYDDGFNHDETLCERCNSIVEFDKKQKEEEKEDEGGLVW